jgi:ferredoxin
MDFPRGRIYLMDLVEKGEIGLSGPFTEHIDRCLGCMACAMACPSGVQYDRSSAASAADEIGTVDHARPLAPAHGRGESDWRLAAASSSGKPSYPADHVPATRQPRRRLRIVRVSLGWTSATKSLETRPRLLRRRP